MEEVYGNNYNDVLPEIPDFVHFTVFGSGYWNKTFCGLPGKFRTSSRLGFLQECIVFMLKCFQNLCSLMLMLWGKTNFFFQKRAIFGTAETIEKLQPCVSNFILYVLYKNTVTIKSRVYVNTTWQYKTSSIYDKVIIEEEWLTKLGLSITISFYGILQNDITHRIIPTVAMYLCR